MLGTFSIRFRPPGQTLKTLNNESVFFCFLMGGVWCGGGGVGCFFFFFFFFFYVFVFVFFFLFFFLFLNVWPGGRKRIENVPNMEKFREKGKGVLVDDG